MALGALRALVLAGGRSTRMGTDKGDLIYYKEPQKYHVAKQLQNLGLETYISLRREQQQDKGYNYIIDSQKEMGPLTGLFSAFEKKEDAWLCVGCDYPFLSDLHFKKLLKARKKSLFATVFQDINTGFLIPTIAIYEAAFFEVLRENIFKNQFSLQQMLTNCPCNIIPVSGEAFISVDTQQDYERIIRKLHFPQGNR